MEFGKGVLLRQGSRRGGAGLPVRRPHRRQRSPDRQAEFVYETNIVSSNIGELLKNISGTSSSGKADAARYEAASRSNSRSGIPPDERKGDPGSRLPRDDLSHASDRCSNIGTSEGGFPSSQIAAAIMRSMSESVVQASTQAAGKIGKTMGAAAGTTSRTCSAENKRPSDQ